MIVHTLADRQLWLQRQLEQLAYGMELADRPEAKRLRELAGHARLIQTEIRNMETIERGLPPPKAENVRETLRVVAREFA